MCVVVYSFPKVAHRSMRFSQLLIATYEVCKNIYMCVGSVILFSPVKLICMADERSNFGNLPRKKQKNRK